jgi:hypothetical protein
MSDSYYGRPILKPHVWGPVIPIYFWIGGTAGAAALHAAFARSTGNDRLATVQQRAALAGVLIAPICLIVDLGKPKRFLNMLRVFKVTSPMSVGSWILVAFSGAIAASNAADLIGRQRSARGFEWLAAALGPLLATYTAVLIADTAVPSWHEAYPTMPFLFVASGLAGAGAVGCAFAPLEESSSARRMMIGGALAMSAGSKLLERRLGTLLAEPYRTGLGGTLNRVSKTLGVSGALLGLLGRRSATWLRVAAACVAAAGVAERFAVLAAGSQSALDPKYTVEPQRARLAANGGLPTAP